MEGTIAALEQSRGWGGSGELRLFGLWEQESDQASGQQQGRHQQHRNSTVGVHQLSKHHVGRDGRHPAHSGEEAERRGPERGQTEAIQTHPGRTHKRAFLE